MIYGVDSIMPANTKLTNGYLLYDWVMRKSCFPSFWGRSISGAGAINKEEIDFLRSKNCKIVCTIRNLNEVEISGNDGTNDANKAIQAAQSIGVPKDKEIALFAEIPSDWSVNHNWMIGFANTVISNGYIPGFIGNTDSSKNFNFGRQCSHYVQATRGAKDFKTLYWSTEPKYDFDPDIWASFAPSELLPTDMDLWRYGSIQFHSINVNKDYLQEKSIMKHFW